MAESEGEERERETEIKGCGRISWEKEHRIWSPKASDEISIGVWLCHLQPVGLCTYRLCGLVRIKWGKNGWECTLQMLKHNIDVRAPGQATL